MCRRARHGDSDDNAMAETIIGLFKTEVINMPNVGPRKSVGRLEWETAKWVHWYSIQRLHGAIGYITPKDAEEAFYKHLNQNEKTA